MVLTPRCVLSGASRNVWGIQSYFWTLAKLWLWSLLALHNHGAFPRLSAQGQPDLATDLPGNLWRSSGLSFSSILCPHKSWPLQRKSLPHPSFMPPPLFCLSSTSLHNGHKLLLDGKPGSPHVIPFSWRSQACPFLGSILVKTFFSYVLSSFIAIFIRRISHSYSVMPISRNPGC